MDTEEKIKYLSQYEEFDYIYHRDTYSAREAFLYFDGDCGDEGDIYGEIYPRLESMMTLNDPIAAREFFPYAHKSDIYALGHYDDIAGLTPGTFACLLGSPYMCYFHFTDRWPLEDSPESRMKEELIHRLSNRDKKRWLIERF